MPLATLRQHRARPRGAPVRAHPKTRNGKAYGFGAATLSTYLEQRRRAPAAAPREDEDAMAAGQPKRRRGNCDQKHSCWLGGVLKGAIGKRGARVRLCARVQCARRLRPSVDPFALCAHICVLAFALRGPPEDEDMLAARTAAWVAKGSPAGTGPFRVSSAAPANGECGGRGAGLGVWVRMLVRERGW